MKKSIIRTAASLLAASFLAVSAAHAADTRTISGAGATFPYPIYAKWAETYYQKTGVQMNYQSIGSGGGIKQIQANTVDFGASDKPLTAAELGNDLIQFPTVMGGVVPVVNLPEVPAGKLHLSGAVLADIFMGKVTKWNAPEIAALNKGAVLPATDITVVHRADGSGTTWIFTNYLSKVSPEWKQNIGNDASVAWPTGLGGKGNEGVAAYVTRTKGAIGYVEYAYALQNKMNYAQLQNAAGNFVAPEEKTFQAAAASADWKNAPGFYMVLTNQSGKEAWPITGATFILFHKQQKDAATAKAVLSFFDWAYGNGNEMAAALDYIPMPKSVVELVQQSWAANVVGPDGKALWTVAKKATQQKAEKSSKQK
jgi:phosphate transport system substrate-binding protein